MENKTKRSETGIDEPMDRFFGPAEWYIGGFMHTPPMWTEEYEKMRVRDLAQRIGDERPNLAQILTYCFWQMASDRKNLPLAPLAAGRLLFRAIRTFPIWSNCRFHRVSKFSQIVEHGKNKTRSLSVSDNVLRRFTRQNQRIR